MMYDVVIIGAGPAGLTTAMQLCRYGFASLVFERAELGGLLKNANWVENYPGFPSGISGVDLVQLFTEQANNLGVQVCYQAVTQVEWEQESFLISTVDGAYRSRILVVASGTRPHPFTDFSVPAGLSQRVAYEIYPWLGLADQHIAIVGAGDAAFDYALNLCKMNQVVILNRGEKRRCLPLLWERASASRHIVYYDNTRLIGIELTPEGKIRLKCENLLPGIPVVFEPSGLVVDYLLGALGREPCLDFASTQFLEEAQDLERRGFLYFIGDVENGMFRQTAIACGDGLRTAMQIYKLLKE